MAMFQLLKIRMSIDIFKNEKCKVIFGLEYIYIYIVNFPFLARLHEVQKSYCSHPGRTRSRSRSRSTLLKFSRSLYLDNQWSESIHTWTIGTL